MVLVVQSSGGGCDDRLEAYDGSKCQVNYLLGRGLGGGPAFTKKALQSLS